MLLGCMLLGVLTSRDGDKNSSLCRFMFLIPSDPEKKKKRKQYAEKMKQQFRYNSKDS